METIWPRGKTWEPAENLENVTEVVRHFIAVIGTDH